MVNSFLASLMAPVLAGAAAAAATVGRGAFAPDASLVAPEAMGSSQAAAADGVKYLITFGDSYSQTGFDVKKAKANPGNPLGNPALPGYTASGGLNWVGFLVTEFNKSTLLSYNFADGGATTDASLVRPFQPTVKSFIDQVGLFNGSLASHPDYAPWKAEDTLFGVWIGVNDVGNVYSNAQYDTLLDKIMDKYFQQLQILYDAGARNFALLSVPPIDKSPMMLRQAETSRKQEVGAISQYNKAIADRLAKLQESNEGLEGRVVDTGAAFNTALEDPKSYGAPDATCYNGDGKSCLWFNDYHPGISINKLVAQAVAKTWEGVFF